MFSSLKYLSDKCLLQTKHSGGAPTPTTAMVVVGVTRATAPPPTPATIAATTPTTTTTTTTTTAVLAELNNCQTSRIPGGRGGPASQGTPQQSGLPPAVYSVRGTET